MTKKEARETSIADPESLAMTMAARLRALESQKRALIATVHDLQAIVRLRLREHESQKRALIATIPDLQAIVRLLSVNRLIVVTDPDEEQE